MKTVAVNEKRGAPAVRKAGQYTHRPIGPVQQAEQTIIRRILRPDEALANSDLDEPEGKHRQESPYKVAESAVPPISGMLTARTDSAPSIQRSENEALENELQRQPEEDEEEPIQTELMQLQPQEQQEEEPLQTKLLQRQPEEDEEEPVQTKLMQLQPQEQQEEEPLQTKLLQRQPEEDEEEPIQTKLMQLQPQEQQEEEPLQTKLLQRQPEEDEEEPVQTKLMQLQPQEQQEEEPLQTKLLQRQPEEDEEEPIQTKLMQLQPQEQQEEEPLQTKPLQRQLEEDEEEPVQTKLMQLQPQEQDEEEPLQTKPLQRQPEEEQEQPVQVKPIQRKVADNNGIKPSGISYIGPEVKAGQAELFRILHPTEAQAKLKIGQPRDEYEREADNIADKVMAMPDSKLQRQSEDEEDQETVQTKSLADQITPLVQRREDEEQLQETLQRLDDEDEEDLVQKKSRRLQAKGETPGLSDDTEQKIQQMRGQGAPLPEGVRQGMENRVGTDFSNVRIHDSGSANDISKQINARAFTLGNDIYFASGEYSPTTERGNRLLAHELTHVVQQGGAARGLWRSNGTGDAGGGSAAASDPNHFQVSIRGMRRVMDCDLDVTINPQNSTVEFDKIVLPAFKIPFHPTPLVREPGSRGEAEENNQQRETWKSDLSGQSGIVNFTQERITTDLHRTPNGSDTYVFTAQRTDRPEFNFIGNIRHIRSEMTIPAWSKGGSGRYVYQVDHKREIQLGGTNDVHNNMWLLIDKTNKACGETIWNFLQRAAALVGEHEREYAGQNNIAPRDGLRNGPDVLSNYRMQFASAAINTSYRHLTEELEPRFYWTYQEISSGDHLGVSNAPVRVRSTADLGSSDATFIMPTQSRAAGSSFTNDETVSPQERHWIKPWIITSKVFWTDENSPSLPDLGQFTIELGRQRNQTMTMSEQSTLGIKRYAGSRYAGYLELDRYFLQDYGKYAITQLSPISIESVSFENPEGGPTIHGKVHPTLGLIEGTDLDLDIAEDEIRVSKLFSLGEIRVPSPLAIDECSLGIFLSTRDGLGVEGQIDIGIDKVGTGFIGASASTGAGFSLEGEFNFDERIFGEGTQAQVRVGYADNQWSMGGTLSIPEGKVTGIRSATVNVDYSESEGFSAEGNAELDVPGVESGTLSVTHSEEEGFAIGGSFNLSSETPGIRSGTISAEVREREDGEGYSVRASGEAVPDIPGINSNLSISYNDGAFTAEVTADYSRGMLSGQVNAGVTNRTVGEDGELSETAEPNNPLIVYGGGELTVQIAPWLQGTAGVRFAPNGEMTVSGEIGLPDVLQIFPRREINRSIFNIAVQAPIFPGIVAEIGGGLGATAGIGPGVIDQLQLGITYNPAHEENTTITGDAHLSVPADAGLRLSVRAGIGLGITGASATGGLEIGGTLGIEGAAEAGVHVDWTPSRGLDLTATVSVHAQPAFTFDISGYVSVRALGFSVYDHTWQFASFRFGSDYRFGIRLPIHYQEGQPFDISLDDVEFEVPEINTNELLRSLIARIA